MLLTPYKKTNKTICNLASNTKLSVILMIMDKALHNETKGWFDSQLSYLLSSRTRAVKKATQTILNGTDTRGFLII